MFGLRNTARTPAEMRDPCREKDKTWQDNVTLGCLCCAFVMCIIVFFDCPGRARGDGAVAGVKVRVDVLLTLL